MENFLLKNEKILLKYQPGKWDYYVYMLTRYILPIFLITLLLGALLVVSGGVTWSFYFIIICGGMGIAFLLIGLVSLLAPTPICIVTNMRIYKKTARMSCWVFYDEIRDIKLILTGKNVGTIKVKTKTIDMLDYNLYLLKNPDEVYRMVKSAWHGKNS